MTSVTTSHGTGKAVRILAAAEDLILKQGFKGVTMAVVAQRAHVGKGTPYLYWRTKEDLFFQLIIGNLADTLLGIAERVRAASDLALPDRLCPTIAEAWLERPLVRALQASDGDVLGSLLDDPRAHSIAVDNGASALIKALLPVWRERGLIRVDWSLDEQAEALELVLVGYFATRTLPLAGGDDVLHLDVLRRTVAAVLLADQDGRASPDVTEPVCAVLKDHAERLRELVA